MLFDLLLFALGVMTGVVAVSWFAIWLARNDDGPGRGQPSKEVHVDNVAALRVIVRNDLETEYLDERADVIAEMEEYVADANDLAEVDPMGARVAYGPDDN